MKCMKQTRDWKGVRRLQFVCVNVFSCLVLFYLNVIPPWWWLILSTLWCVCISLIFRRLLFVYEREYGVRFVLWRVCRPFNFKITTSSFTFCWFEFSIFASSISNRKIIFDCHSIDKCNLKLRKNNNNPLPLSPISLICWIFKLFFLNFFGCDHSIVTILFYLCCFVACRVCDLCCKITCFTWWRWFCLFVGCNPHCICAIW